MNERRPEARPRPPRPEELELGRLMADGLNRGVTKQEILDEFARREGKRYGFEYKPWNMTDEFHARFDAAYAAKPKSQSCELFAREFVDAWPTGQRVTRTED